MKNIFLVGCLTLLLVITKGSVFADIIVGTWNGNWFPSGRAEHRAHSDVENATIKASAKMLANCLHEMDPQGTNDVILCLNEIRGPKVASNLVHQIGRTNLRVVVVTGYRRRDRFDQQQDVIATTLPVVDAHWSRWKGKNKIYPPRGYAFASLVIQPSVTAHVYAVHLKSNYGAKKAAVAKACRDKRTVSIEQLIEQEKVNRSKSANPVIIAGDLNADRWKREFKDEQIFSLLDEAGFLNPLGDLPADARGTHYSLRVRDLSQYKPSALDYILYRGLSTQELPRIFESDRLSDHRALFVRVTTP